jgi:3-hydroxyisobutyrate dehydrogenase-like beta-hydroxyacid dehydrogenase
MTPVSDEELAAADFILSIVPPGEAQFLADRLTPMLGRSRRKPVYVDCNAVSPETVTRIAAIVAATECPFIDAGIIGGPPKPGADGPMFYASGPAAARLAVLGEYGLAVRVLDGPIGAASGLKMSYAGITKGLTALGAGMMLAATRAGAAEALHRELAESQPALLAWLTRQVPGMYPKAYRWVAEMEEIADFVGADPATQQIFTGAAQLYERLAADVASENLETGLLTSFLEQTEEDR